MSHRIAYVISGRLDASLVPSIENGLRPCPEFVRFVSRNDADLLSANDARPPPRWMGRVGRRFASSRLSLANSIAAPEPGRTAFVTSGEDIGIPLALALRFRRSLTPLLIQLHGHYFGNRKFAALAPILRAMGNVRVLCLSKSLRDHAVREYGFSQERCVSVGYGVDTRFFSPGTKAPDGDVPLIVSAGLASRDYGTLIAAIRDLPVKLRIAADSPWTTETDKSVLDDLPANVEFKSAGSYMGLRDLYARASFVVVPMKAVNHACGYAVIAEAMAMGKAVIATRQSAPCDFFQDSEHGFYVNPNDVADLRDAIQRLTADPALTARLGLAARRQMEDTFNLDRFCARIEQYLPRVDAPAHQESPSTK